MRVFTQPNNRFIIRLQFAFHEYHMKLMGVEDSGTILINDHLHVSTKGGTLIVPADGSYVRFIADSWYSDIDVQNL